MSEQQFHAEVMSELEQQSTKDKIMNVHKKLMRARIALQNSEMTKSGHNKFAGYYYFELGDFLPIIQNIFLDIGLCGIVSYTAETAILTITDTETGESIVITSPMGSAALKGCHEVQNIGAVETYQRRYLWVTALEIVEHDAIDSTTGKEKPEPVKQIDNTNVVQVMDYAKKIHEAFKYSPDEAYKFYLIVMNDFDEDIEKQKALKRQLTPEEKTEFGKLFEGANK